MSAWEILEDFVDEIGWDIYSQIGICLDFIDEKLADEAQDFADYLARIAAEEMDE